MIEHESLPVVPLRNAVVFPGVSLPVAVGRRGTIRSIERASRGDGLVFAVRQKNGGEVVSPDLLSTVGTVARVSQIQRGLAGIQVVLQGETRSVAVRYEDDGYTVAVRGLADEVPSRLDEPAYLGLYQEVRERAAELGRRSGLSEEIVRRLIESVDDPGRLADLVAGYLDVSSDQKQKLLETVSVEDRLRRVLVFTQKQISVLAAREDIQSRVQKELGDRQRELVLREQLRAIQEELGEGDDDTALADLRTRLDEIELPDEARKEVEREWSRLQRMSMESMEAQVVRTFLETVGELPWNERSEGGVDVKAAAAILDEDHYGLADVKERILDHLAVRQLAEQEAGERKDRAPILLFVGPPGVGKTSVAKSIARAMGRGYVRVSLGGARDEADIRGHRRTYVGAMPGRIMTGMRQAGVKNPVFLLDEIDKLGVSYQGDPSSALLEVLDPAQNDTFTDHYLGLPFDLSQVTFIATANMAQRIPAPLMDRMEVIEFSGYTEAEKVEIAERYLVPRQREEHHLADPLLRVSREGLTRVVTRYTREAGVRQLEREIGRLARKVARQVAMGETDEAELDGERVSGLLGRPRFRSEEAARGDQVGVATGLSYTPAGGDILFVEAATMPGTGKLVLTGQLGDVMRESAQAAWTYARANAAALGLGEHPLADRDVHVHVPAGAVPKDGPSAGVAMATAAFSTLTGHPVRRDVAMTGEITLTGRVLPIGGVKEKVLGAVRAGIRTIVLPRANLVDLEDVPEEVLGELEVHGVEHLGEALAVTLRDATFSAGRLLFPGDVEDEVRPLSGMLPS